VSSPAPVSAQIEQLLLSARTALNERRLLAPAGNNAIESYLAVLELEANHVGARQALLELIPPASDAVESAIAGGELDEAQRRFELFKQMGVSELRLNPIRTSLAAARVQAERVAADTAAADAAAAATAPLPTVATAAPSAPAPASIPTSAVVAAPDPTTPPMPAPTAPGAAAQSQPPPPPATAVVTPEPVATAAAVPTPVADVTEPRQIVDATPIYPANARQRRLEGWVELEIAIGSDGAVGEVSVVRSEPAKVFDREAVRAAQRWRFEPRRENGVAVATRVRKTLNFKLSAG
jgi:protein TonB